MQRTYTLNLTVMEEKLVICKASYSLITVSSKKLDMDRSYMITPLVIPAFCRDITPELVLVEMNIYWDKALLLGL